VDKLVAFIALVGLTVWVGCAQQTASMGAGAEEEVAVAVEETAVEEEIEAVEEAAVEAVEEEVAAAPKTREIPTTAAPSLLVPGGLAKEKALADASAPDSQVVILETDKGRIVIELYPGDAPEHVANFKKLVEDRFYSGVGRTFHRYVEGFIIQGGDPEGRGSRAGTGGPGYTIPAEIGRKHIAGTVAAARQGDNVNPDRVSNGSQFYICTEDAANLDGAYSAFGQVIQGMDTVRKLRVGDEITKCELRDRSSVVQE
jgi:peptidyl-prolyl cis-trans isomerase B (cyclophilin B)